MTNTRTRLVAALAVGALGSASSAEDISITVENLGASGGFSYTPLWVAAHNGGFDSYDNGAAASAALETLAELGDTGPLSAAFAGSAAGAAGGVDATLASSSAAPVFSPGESETFGLNVGDSTVNQYFSFASMVVPSNDLFIGNGDPFAIKIFNDDGSFAGPVVLNIFGFMVNDAGTEANDAADGPAFLDGVDGTLGTDEGGTVRDFFTVAGDAGYLSSFVGLTTADGNVLGATFGEQEQIARITITPTPGSLAVLGLGGLVALRRRR